MSKVIAAPFVTVDGLIAGPNGEMDWNIAGFNDEMGKWVDQVYSRADTFLFGRVTYTEFLKFWPGADTETDPLAGKVNNAKKVVFSKTLDKVEWGTYGNIVLVKDNLAEEINKLKQETDKDLLIIGSGRLTQSLTNLGLIDEYHLMVHPVILGKGKPLFRDIDKQVDLELTKSETFKNGVVTLEYKLKK